MTEYLKGVGAVVNKTGCCTKCRGQYPLMKKMFIGHKDTCCYPALVICVVELPKFDLIL